jgi:hypothetical protein
MGFLDKAKAAAEQAKVKAQEGVEQVQAKKETTQAYWDLGHKAYELASSGAISHPELEPLVQRITELESHDGAGPGSAAGPTETPPAETWAPTQTAESTTADPEQATTATPPQTPA